MTPTFVTEAVQVLRNRYGDDQIRTAGDGGRTLVRVSEVELYEGCSPRSTPMLLVLDPGQPKPQVYVQPGQLLANGKAPKSTSVVMVGGESWLQFSFSIPWDESNGIIRFVAAARQRFVQHD